jgi:hypothetical protein
MQMMILQMKKVNEKTTTKKNPKNKTHLLTASDIITSF